MPLDGFDSKALTKSLTSYFGNRENPILKKPEFHTGIDIACLTGTKATAIFDGNIVETGVSPTYGIYLIYENDLHKVMYAHLSKLLVKSGSVKKSDALALTGSTGLSTGPHLHMTIWEDGLLSDPLKYIPN